jgi:hypothetical protein
MHDLAHRFALALLVACGVLSVALVPWDAGFAAMREYLADTPGPWAVMQTQHRQFLLALLGVGLVVSAFMPGLRAAALGASILSKTAYVALALASARHVGDLSLLTWIEAAMALALITTAAVLAQEARQEARWQGVLPLRPEA